ncbi:MAG: hypothetical protein AVDCRST_MAG03-1901, partial [uncultured Rubrobacteraceae bacterium]
APHHATRPRVHEPRLGARRGGLRVPRGRDRTLVRRRDRRCVRRHRGRRRGGTGARLL